MKHLGTVKNRKLREDALRSFVKALHTGRMVAVTGALSTKSKGYPSWPEFKQTYALVALDITTKILDTRRGEEALDWTASGAIIKDIRQRSLRLLINSGGDRPDYIISTAEINKYWKILNNRQHPTMIDARVEMWAISECFKALDQELVFSRAGLVIDNEYQEPALATFQKRIAAIFLSRTYDESSKGHEAAITPLLRSLGIQRIATLNYDLELERALMLRHDEATLLRNGEQEIRKLINTYVAGTNNETNDSTNLKESRLNVLRYAAKSKLKEPGESHFSPTDESVDPVGNTEDQGQRPPASLLSGRVRPKLSSVADFIGMHGSGKPIVQEHRNRLSRTLGDGLLVESDIVDRERPDRLFEFAVGSARPGRHILHLHGRADAPESLVINIRQYDRLYRLDDLYRDPFDHSLRVLFGGNPILFVGLGMTEPELNEKLQYFVSNAPFSRLAPAFVVWNPTKKERLDPLWLQERRLDFRTRLGVHLIYLDDLPPPPATSETATEKGMSADQGATEQEEDKTEADLSREMAALLERLPELVRRVDRRLKRRGAWRSIQLRLEDRLKNRQAVRLWGALALQKEVMERGINVLPRQGECSYQSPDNLVFAAAHIGQGRGALAEALMNGAEGWLRIENIYLRPTAPKDRLLINAGFSYNSNAVLNGISRFLSTRLVSGLATQSFSREASYGDGSLFQTNNPVLIIINGVDRFFSSDGTLLSAELDHLLRSIRRVKQNMVQVLLLGTERLRPYCEALGCHLNIIIKIEKTSHNTKSDNQGAVNGIDTQTLLEKICTPNRQLNSAYLEWVAERFKDFALRASNGKLSPELDITDSAAARIERALDVDRNGLNRAFFEAYLFPPLLQSLQLNCPATFEVLRTMCFIGSPIQAGILLYAPKVRSILAEDPVKGSTSIKSPNEIISELEKVVANLIKLHLLIVFEPYIPHSEVAAYRKYDAEQKVNYAQSGDPSHMGTSQLHDHGKYSARGGFIDIRADSVLRLRVGLHRSLAAFLRDRHGAPINDAKLATTFNLSMFMSNPGEDYSPEPNFHTELGDLVDSLVGAWHDILAMQKFCTSQFLKKLNKLSINKEKMPLACEEKEKIIDAYRDGVKIKNAVSKSAELQNEIQDLYSHKDSHKFIIRSIFARSSSMAASCLRAALSLVRGYYSTAALLKLDQGDRTNVDDSYGALTDHALRLDRLINGFGDCSVARTIYRKVFLAEGNSELSAEYAAHLGADPFYEDDLVWLHNERGVVALAQGNLYEARDAFGAAMEINKERVDLDYQGNYWRRIAINMVTTQIERGHLKPAERLLEQLETSIHTQVSQGEVITAGEPATMGATLRHADQIRALFHAIDRPPPIRGNSLYSRELILCVAMSTGYRATIAQMRGRYHEAKDLFEISIKMLRCLGEQRAFAHFERSYATLHIFIGEKQEALRHIEYAIAAAQSAKQMDILHRSRVVRADLWHQSFSDPRVLRQAQQDIRDALTYAAASDCYRVRIEASTSLAKHVRHGGDYDTALRYAADAMTIACRYGHAQHRTSLRIEIGQALKARGDPKSGDALLDQAVAISTGRGFHHILERVRLARNEHIPDLPTFTPPTVR